MTLFYMIAVKYSDVDDYINTMKTTFDFNFDLYQVVKKHVETHKHRNKENMSVKKGSL